MYDLNKSALLNLSLEEKIQRTKELILEWFLQYEGQVFVSFSGGKDSTVLLHIARSLKKCGDIPAVFSDTGLEYPEIREFVKKQDNVIWIKPRQTFKEVIEKYGYPIISKDQSAALYDLRTTKSERTKEARLSDGWGYRNGVLAKKWRPLLNADFKISDKCCLKIKKEPLHRYEKETGKHAIIGVMAVESERRLHQFLSGNCNAFSEKHPTSRPIMFWTEQDIFEYIARYKLEIASVYGKIIKENGLWKTTGANRTGCMFCMYGLHLEGHPNRFERMKKTHPKQYDYIINKLNGSHVINEYLKCDPKARQIEMELAMEEDEND